MAAASQAASFAGRAAIGRSSLSTTPSVGFNVSPLVGTADNAAVSPAPAAERSIIDVKGGRLRPAPLQGPPPAPLLSFASAGVRIHLAGDVNLDALPADAQGTFVVAGSRAAPNAQSGAGR